jgi:hypothetical protein
MNKETIEEVAEKLYGNDIYAQDNIDCFKDGYKLAQERMYSEEDVIQIRNKAVAYGVTDSFKEWFEQFKKK